MRDLVGTLINDWRYEEKYTSTYLNKKSKLVLMDVSMFPMLACCISHVEIEAAFTR